MGKKPTGEFSIKIINVYIRGNNINIYIEEKYPDSSSFITQDLTYPIEWIKFFIIPNEINIKSKKSGENFILIDDFFEW